MLPCCQADSDDDDGMDLVHSQGGATPSLGGRGAASTLLQGHPTPQMPPPATATSFPIAPPASAAGTQVVGLAHGCGSRVTLLLRRRSSSSGGGGGGGGGSGGESSGVANEATVSSGTLLSSVRVDLPLELVGPLPGPCLAALRQALDDDSYFTVLQRLYADPGTCIAGKCGEEAA